jgi:hypothetical protein
MKWVMHGEAHSQLQYAMAIAAVPQQRSYQIKDQRWQHDHLKDWAKAHVKPRYSRHGIPVSPSAKQVRRDPIHRYREHCTRIDKYHVTTDARPYEPV